jgi:hypothetical protein
MYSFDVIDSLGKNKGSYYHVLFSRENQELAQSIRRTIPAKRTSISTNIKSIEQSDTPHESSSVDYLSTTSPTEPIAILASKLISRLQQRRQQQEPARPFNTTQIENKEKPLARLGLTKPKLMTIEAFRASMNNRQGSNAPLQLPASAAKNMACNNKTSYERVHNYTNPRLAPTVERHPTASSTKQFNVEAQKENCLLYLATPSCINFRSRRNSSIAYSA